MVIFCELQHVEIDILLVDKSILREYLQQISGAKPKTIKRKIASVKAMFNYLEFEDILQTNPFRKMSIKIKEPLILPKVMVVNEVRNILKFAYDDVQNIEDKSSYTYKEKIRNLAVIELLFATGARVSELCQLRTNDIDFVNWTLKLFGKGGKERVIQVCEKETISTLEEYYELFKNDIATSGAFLINRFKKPLSAQSVRFLVKDISKRVGIERNITPHVFRHTFATLLLEKDVDIKYIQHLLGHSSIMTTQIYTHVNKQKQQEILETKHPRSGFSLNIG